MRGRVVVGQPPPQEPVQHNAVQQRLQRVVRVQHGLDHPVPPVIGRGERRVTGAQPVGLVVDDDEALPDSQHHVHRTGQIPAQRLAAQQPRRQPVGIDGHRIIGRQMFVEQRSDVGQPRELAAAQVTAGHRELEIQLAQPVPQPDLAQGHAGCQRAQRGVVHRHQRRRQLVDRDLDRPAGRMAAHLGPQLGRQVRGQRVGGLQHRMHERAERGSGGQRGHRRRHVERLGPGRRR